jgi:hypothetical protein
MPSDALHPGITMHKIRIGAGVAGFIVVTRLPGNRVGRYPDAAVFSGIRNCY